MKIAKAARDFALKHSINLGRGEYGEYFVRDPETREIVEMTRSVKPTAKQAIAMMRRYLNHGAAFRSANPKARRITANKSEYASVAKPIEVSGVGPFGPFSRAFKSQAAAEKFMDAMRENKMVSELRLADARKGNPKARDPEHRALLEKLDTHFAADESKEWAGQDCPACGSHFARCQRDDPRRGTVCDTTGEVIKVKRKKNPDDRFTVEPYRVHVRDDGRTASIFGAVPWTSADEATRWAIEQRGWTIRDNHFGTVGMGRKPFTTKKEAEAMAREFNDRFKPRKQNPVENRQHAFQGITTKYLSATNTKSSRIKATTASGISITVAYDHGLDAYENHVAAAEALQEKMHWRGLMVGGATQDGYAFTIRDTDDAYRMTPKENPAARVKRGEWVATPAGGAFSFARVVKVSKGDQYGPRVTVRAIGGEEMTFEANEISKATPPAGWGAARNPQGRGAFVITARLFDEAEGYQYGRVLYYRKKGARRPAEFTEWPGNATVFKSVTSAESERAAVLKKYGRMLAKYQLSVTESAPGK